MAKRPISVKKAKREARHERKQAFAVDYAKQQRWLRELPDTLDDGKTPNPVKMNRYARRAVIFGRY